MAITVVHLSAAVGAHWCLIRREGSSRIDTQQTTNEVEVLPQVIRAWLWRWQLPLIIKQYSTRALSAADAAAAASARCLFAPRAAQLYHCEYNSLFTSSARYGVWGSSEVVFRVSRDLKLDRYFT